MTVLDSSGVVDYLLVTAGQEEVAELIHAERELAAPDVVVFEVLAAVRRGVLRGLIEASRAHAALADLAEVPLRLFPSIGLVARAWDLRPNLTAADALFVALAERLAEPLATRDGRLAAAVDAMPDVAVEVVLLEA